jgi:protoporphyrinogen oxidase
VGSYSNISPGVCPPDCSSIYVEVGVPGDGAGEIDLAGDLVPRVDAALLELGLIRPRSIVCRVIHVIRCAYVHHTPERDRVLAWAADYLERFGVFLIGRYGRWDYIGMEDSIASGLDMARRLTA